LIIKYYKKDPRNGSNFEEKNPSEKEYSRGKFLRFQIVFIYSPGE
jgi:hypothetical protein